MCNYVVKCAQDHQDDAANESAYGALSSLCRHPENQAIVHEKRAHKTLLRTLRSGGHKDPTLIQYTLDAMASMSHGHAKNAGTLIEEDAATIVLSTIDSNASSAEIVRSGCIVLVVLREVKGGSALMVSKGAIPCVLRASRVHLEKYEMQHILCALMGQLVREVPASAEMLVGASSDDDESDASLLLRILKKYPEHWLIAEACCLLIVAPAALPLTEAALRARVARCLCGETSDWGGLVAVMKAHAKRPNLQLAACRGVAALSQFPEGSSHLHGSGAIGIALKTLSSHFGEVKNFVSCPEDSERIAVLAQDGMYVVNETLSAAWLLRSALACMLVSNSAQIAAACCEAVVAFGNGCCVDTLASIRMVRHLSFAGTARAKPPAFSTESCASIAHGALVCLRVPGMGAADLKTTAAIRKAYEGDGAGAQKAFLARSRALALGRTVFAYLALLLHLQQDSHAKGTQASSRKHSYRDANATNPWSMVVAEALAWLRQLKALVELPGAIATLQSRPTSQLAAVGSRARLLDTDAPPVTPMQDVSDAASAHDANPWALLLAISAFFGAPFTASDKLH